jgi:hypothetical protein
MNKTILIRILQLITAIIIFATFVQAFDSKHREISRSKEKSLHIFLEVSFGSISIERGESDKIATIDYNEEETSKQKVFISYEIVDGSGELHIKTKESRIPWDDDEDHEDHHNDLYIKLSDAVPISFEIDLGAGKGDINLTDLQVKDMKISTGASKVMLKCNKPNPISADDIFIESGVGKFTAKDLANLNSNNLKFSGGIGSYTLDFSGKFNRNTEAQVEIGLGTIKIDIPKSIPAQIVYDDHWLSSFHIDGDFSKKQDDVYETEDFDNASKHIIIRLESGLGSVRITRK